MSGISIITNKITIYKVWSHHKDEDNHHHHNHHHQEVWMMITMTTINERRMIVIVLLVLVAIGMWMMISIIKMTIRMSVRLYALLLKDQIGDLFCWISVEDSSVSVHGHRYCCCQDICWLKDNWMPYLIVNLFLSSCVVDSSCNKFNKVPVCRRCIVCLLTSYMCPTWTPNTLKTLHQRKPWVIASKGMCMSLM